MTVDATAVDARVEEMSLVPTRMSRRALIGGVAAGALLVPAGVVGLGGGAYAAKGSATVPAAEGVRLFTDFFSRTSLGSAWTAFNRAAHVAGGRLQMDGAYLPGRSGRDGWVLTHVGDKTWRDYNLKVSTDSTNAAPGFPREVHMVTLYGRVASGTTASGAVIGRGTCYRLDIWDPGQPDPAGSGGTLTHGEVQLWRVRNGVGTKLAEVRASHTVPGSNSVLWWLQGARHVVYVNGAVALTFTDPSPITYGGVGVGSIWEVNASFDDVAVESI